MGRVASDPNRAGLCDDRTMRNKGWLLSVAFAFGCATSGEECEGDGDGGGGGGSLCCKVCEDSKACGDSCIGTSQTCHKTGGCACNGFAPEFTAPVEERDVHAR